MLKHFDHLTIVVRDVERAKEFFAILGDDFRARISLPGLDDCVATDLSGMKRSSTPRRASQSRLSLQDLFDQRVCRRIGIQQPVRLIGTENRQVALEDSE